MSADSNKVRAFIALKPPAKWIDQLGAVQAVLKKELKSREIKWVAPEQIHITLRFLGWIPAEEVPQISQLITTVSAQGRPFVLRGGRLGCFPSARRPRVLWMGIEDDANHAMALQTRIQKETGQFGEPPEDRAFSPHLTLARIKEIDRESRSIIERLLQKEWELTSEWKVLEVLLMQSHLSPQGARYEVLHSAALGAGD